MIQMCNWRWTILIGGLALMVGVLHGMKPIEFYNHSSQLIEDIDELVSLIVTSASDVVVKLARVGTSDRIQEVADHYNLMVNRAEPICAFVSKDFQKLIKCVNNLESVNMVMKLLYDYFRQSAINLIDHLKYVYNLD